MYAHIKANNDYFITKNSAHYINGGRKERLKENFGITVLEPEELLDLLQNPEHPQDAPFF